MAAHDPILNCCVCDKSLADPILLDCLHNCCKRHVTEPASQESRKLVTCPKCDAITDVNTECDNQFVAAILEQQWECFDVARKCSYCSERGVNVDADLYCNKCACAYCTECNEHHRKFLPKHKVATLNGLSSASCLDTKIPVCIDHGEKLKYVCSECKRLKCATCRKKCTTLKHNIEPRECDAVDAMIQYIKAEMKLNISEVARLCSSMDGTSRRAEVNEARKTCSAILARNKKAAMDSLDNAFIEANTELEKLVDALEEEASQADRLRTKLTDAVAYAQHLLDSANDTWLLDQHHRVQSHLQLLAGQHVEVRNGLQCKDLISISQVPTNDEVHTITRSLIGTPRPTPDETVNGSPTQANAENRSPPHFDFAYAFTSPTMCSDVAVTADGGLLLAAKMHGLIEFNAEGKELGRWLPALRRPVNGREDWVSTVDILDDGRAVVDLQYSKLVVLLARSPNSDRDLWTEKKRVACLDSPPWMLAAHADVIAVAECQRVQDRTKWLPDDDEGWVPGPHLSLLTASGSQEPWRRQLDYDIFALVVTAQAVITSSYGRVAMDDDSERYFMLESHSHDGSPLWRQQQKESVDDLCATLAGHVLYAALPVSKQVVAINSDDGSLLEESGLILKHKGENVHGLLIPTRLSLRRGKDTFLSILAQDFKTVSIYRAEYGAM